jgi:hypothetical protein
MSKFRAVGGSHRSALSAAFSETFLSAYQLSKHPAFHAADECAINSTKRSAYKHPIISTVRSANDATEWVSEQST